MKNLLFIIVGWIGVVLGAIAAFLPLIPSFPFLLLAAICFGKGSERWHTWFKQTKLYKENLENFLNKEGMTIKAKVRMITVVSLTMAFGFMMMHRVPVGRIILVIVWLGHILYFWFKVKTIPISNHTFETKLTEIEEND